MWRPVKSTGCICRSFFVYLWAIITPFCSALCFRQVARQKSHIADAYLAQSTKVTLIWASQFLVPVTFVSVFQLPRAASTSVQHNSALNVTPMLKRFSAAKVRQNWSLKWRGFDKMVQLNEGPQKAHPCA